MLRVENEYDGGTTASPRRRRVIHHRGVNARGVVGSRSSSSSSSSIARALERRAMDMPEAWPTAAQRAFDASVRCAICGDVFAMPVSFRACAHTFCSDCIRRALPAMDGKCPQCRESAVESDLIPNKALEHAVRCFKDARGELLDAAVLRAKTKTKTKTKTKSDAGTNATAPRDVVTLVLSDSESDDQYDGVEPTPPSTTSAPCPVCNAHVSLSLMNAHLNTCLVKNEALSSPARKRKKTPPPSSTANSPQREHQVKRLPKLAYHVFPVTKLRDMCKKEGLNASGDKKQLEIRHKEFTTRVNSIIEYGRVPDFPAIAREVNREEARKAGAGAKARMFNTVATNKEKAAADAARTDNETFARLIEEVRNRQKQKQHDCLRQSPTSAASDDNDDDDDDDDAEEEEVLPLSQAQPKYVTSSDDDDDEYNE